MEAAMNFPTNVPIPVQIFGSGRKMKEFKARIVLGLSITQIIIGCMCVMLMSLSMSLDPYCFRSPCLIGYGIQAGVLYCISGILGCCSWRFKTNKCLIISVMVMNILSAAFSIIPLVFGPVDTINKTNYSILAPIFIIILAIVESVIAITVSAFCCHFVCGCCSNEPFYPSYAFYDTKTQQFVFLPGGHGALLSQNPDWSIPVSLPPSDKDSETAGEISGFNYSHLK